MGLKMIHKCQVTYAFDAAHQLFLPYASKCNNKHGHRYNVITRLSGPLNSCGMIVDFVHVKQAIMEQYDQQDLNEVMGSTATTAENLAHHIHATLNLALSCSEEFKLLYWSVKIDSITLFETPGNEVTGEW